ncbi:DDB1- and CUL4-associated factor 10 [Sciurus carolinensis]|uniref:DDB1- and CUL4-associated factor 10 n=1 Tax=Sciurus carolinensis TaxID=30640 RepID=A0AA41MX60_SCICA|nr:DDB1- and CUL4-associated factor 10 [Sciurus carolinensis]
MFPFGPRSPGGDVAAGADEHALQGEQAAAARPPSPAALPVPAQPGADAAPPPPAARGPRRPGSPALLPAARAGELAPPRSCRVLCSLRPGRAITSLPAASAARADCRVGSLGRQGLSAGLDGSGARLVGWLRERSLGRGLFVDPAQDNFRTMTNLYGSIHPADSVYLSTRTHGAVFNLEYSPDGSVMTVACEQTEVLLFDPISSKHIKTLSEAHEDCVNNIRFLDNRLFSTRSVDTTIALWDLRKLNTKVCTFHGHTSWVKNIEYGTNTRLSNIRI